MGAQCGICKGRLGPIRYDEPSDSKHPLSFVIDEVIPVSRWEQAGYASAAAAADDFQNLQAAHRICNQMKSNKINFSFPESMKQLQEKQKKHKPIAPDGDW